jgi:hypothetical protein
METIESLTRGQLADRTAVIARLRRLTEAGGDHNYLIVEIGVCRYVQFLSSCGSAVIYAEVSSGKYCRPGCPCPPTPTERAQLLALGWRPPTKRKFLNFYRFAPFLGQADGHAMSAVLEATVRVVGGRGARLRVKEYLDW